MEDITKELTKESAKVVGEVYEDGLKATVKQVGLVFGTAPESAFRWTYPMRLKNEKRRLEFQRNIQMLNASFETIPDQKVIEVAL